MTARLTRSQGVMRPTPDARVPNVIDRKAVVRCGQEAPYESPQDPCASHSQDAGVTSSHLQRTGTLGHTWNRHSPPVASLPCQRNQGGDECYSL